MKYSIGYKPKTITQVNWYVSPDDQSSPIHIFDTQKEAITFAKEQPEIPHRSGVTIPAYIGWLHKGGTPRLEVSNTRKTIDHRVRTKKRTVYVRNGRLTY